MGQDSHRGWKAGGAARAEVAGPEGFGFVCMLGGMEVVDALGGWVGVGKGVVASEDDAAAVEIHA
jgi:hypothetical protein